MFERKSVSRSVRKHRAPKGALRRGHEALEAAGNVGQKAPSAKRCIKTPGYGSTDAYCRGEVRKHQAPKGALRLSQATTGSLLDEGQKAPSAIRRIKTYRALSPHRHWPERVRKNRAPKGAFRLGGLDTGVGHCPCVRKHRAPKGALRQLHRLVGGDFRRTVKKHRAQNGALRREILPIMNVSPSSGQKAPSAKRRIKTVHFIALHVCQLHESESTERQKVH